MPSILEDIEALCRNLIGGGVPKSEVTSNLGTLAVHIRSGNADVRRTATTGPLFELFRWEHQREMNAHFPTDSASKVGDVYYRDAPTSQLNVVQLKWVTGKNKKALTSNLSKALAQLAGTVEGNKEAAPTGSKAIARVGLQNLSFVNDSKSYTEAIAQVQSLIEDSNLQGEIQVDIFDTVNDWSHTVNVSNGKTSVVSTGHYFATPEALSVWRTIYWAEQIFNEAEDMGYKAFGHKITELKAAL